MNPDIDPVSEDDEQLSPTAYLLQEMALYGHRPFDDEPDPRPLPDSRIVGGAVADMFDAMVASLQDTRLEPDLEDLLWHIVNIFHRAGERVGRELDDNEQTQKRMQREQDGSEVKSAELERALAEGVTMVERRDAMEFFRDAAADQFRLHTRKAWIPRAGSKVNRKALTSAVVSSRDFINTRRWVEKTVLIPPGERIYLTGGTDYNDHRLIWSTLDKVHAKHPTMVLLHGGSKLGCERIAENWADTRQVPQLAFAPDFKKHNKQSAPFKRNDTVLEVLPIGVIVFPGGGIQDNLADKAKAMGIAVMDFRKGGGA